MAWGGCRLGVWLELIRRRAAGQGFLDWVMRPRAVDQGFGSGRWFQGPLVRGSGRFAAKKRVSACCSARICPKLLGFVMNHVRGLRFRAVVRFSVEVLHALALFLAATSRNRCGSLDGDAVSHRVALRGAG